MNKSRPFPVKNRPPLKKHMRIMVHFFMKYKPLGSIYENEKEYICFPETDAEPFAVFCNKRSHKYKEVFFYEDSDDKILNALREASLIQGKEIFVYGDDDSTREIIEKEVEKEYIKTLQEYISFFNEDPCIGSCTDICPRPKPKLISAMKRAIKRGSKLRHNEIYERGGWSYNDRFKRGNFKLFDTEKYLYRYYPPICEEDQSKIEQIDKITKEKRWVREIDAYDDLKKATLIGYFDPDCPEIVMIKKVRKKREKK